MGRSCYRGVFLKDGFVGILLSFFLSQAYAYTPTLTEQGIPIRWNDRVKLDLAGNPRSVSAVGENEFFSAVTRGLQRWQTASRGSVEFDYWQGSDPGIYEPSSNYNGLSSIFFASNAKSNPGLSTNVLGLTQVWYDTNSGKILEADIILNDKDFNFTTNSRDTSGYGSGSPRFGNGKANVYIENVITHELGHAFGLSHSGSLQSTMLFMESPEQAHLGCDEQIGIRAVYRGGEAQGAQIEGMISGTVITEGGAPIFGAHVLVISRQRGTVLATAVTNGLGQFNISALEPGSYFLFVEPFFGGAQTLPSYYSNIKNDVCPGGRSFGRSFLTDETGFGLHGIELAAGAMVTAPPITARCNSFGGASVAGVSVSEQLEVAPVLYDGTSDAKNFGATDRFVYSNTVSYKLKALLGKLEIHAIGYSLYSPIHAKLELLDKNGQAVPIHLVDFVYQGDSGYINYDSSFVAEGLDGQDYYLRISASGLNTSLYPAGPIALDTVPFLVITGSVNNSPHSNPLGIPNNARCRMDENFMAYASPSGGPPRKSLEDEEKSGTGFCGTLRNGNSGSPPNASPGEIVGWLLPWLLMGFSSRMLARSCRVPARQLP